MINVTEYLSDAGGQENEDLVWFDDKNILVLDGATGLGGQGMSPAEFVRRFRNGYVRRITGGMDLAGSINGAVKEAGEAAVKRGGASPSAAGAFVHENGDALEVAVVADCCVVLHMENGSILRLTDKRVSRFDEAVLRRVRETAMSAGITAREALERKEIREMMAANRGMMNRPGGYGVLAPGFVYGAESIFRTDRNRVRRTAVYTDGFGLAARDILSDRHSAEELLSKQRKLENADPDFALHPRFKLHDDASIVMADIE